MRLGMEMGNRPRKTPLSFGVDLKKGVDPGILRYFIIIIMINLVLWDVKKYL